MKFREQIRQRCRVIDLMSVAAIIAFPIPAVFVLAETSSHVFYHRAPNWHSLMKPAVGNGIAYLIVAGAWYLWKRRRSSRKSPSPPVA